MRSYLDFEKPVADLEAKVEELRALSNGGDTASIGEELTKLEAKAAKALTELYANLTPWQKTQVARSSSTLASRSATGFSKSRYERICPRV